MYANEIYGPCLLFFKNILFINFFLAILIVFLKDVIQQVYGPGCLFYFLFRCRFYSIYFLVKI